MRRLFISLQLFGGGSDVGTSVPRYATMASIELAIGLALAQFHSLDPVKSALLEPRPQRVLAAPLMAVMMIAMNARIMRPG